MIVVRMRGLCAAFITLIAATQVLAAPNCGLLATSGDFEHGSVDWSMTGEIVPDPVRASNHVAALHGELPAAAAPVVIPSSIDAVEVRFRVLAPRTLKLHGDPKLVLRIRLYSKQGNSRFNEVEVAPSDQWQTKRVRILPVEGFRDEVLLEALNCDGIFYVDDFCVVASAPNQGMQPAGD